MTCVISNEMTRKRLPCLNVKKYKQIFLTALMWTLFNIFFFQAIYHKEVKIVK